MVGQMTLALRADPSQYEDAIKRLSRATSEWELSTASSADDVDEKFAEVIRALVDMERQGGRTEDNIKKSLRAIGLSSEDAEDALKAIDRELDNVGDNDGGDKAADSLDGIGTKADGVGDGIRTLGDIAKSVLEGDFGEAAGSAVSALGSIAGALAGGAVGGAIGTAISGIVGSWVDQWNAAAEESEKRIEDMTSKIIDANGKIDESFVMSGVKSYLADADLMDEATRLQAASGVELQTVLRALNGDMTDAQTVTQGLADTRDALTESQRRNLDAGKSMNDGLSDETQQLLKGEDVWKKYNAAVGEAGAAYDVFNAAQSTGLQRTAEAAVAAGEATKEIDAFGDAVYRMPDGKVIYVDAETGQATTDMQAVEDKQFAEKTVTVRAVRDTSAWDNWIPGTKVATVKGLINGVGVLQ